MLAPMQILLTVSFLDFLAAGMIVPQLQNQARSLGCSHLHLGMIGAAYSATQLFGAPIVGNLSDLKGRKPTMIFSLIVSGTAYFLLGITSSLVCFFALRACLGFFKQTQLLTKSITPDYESDPARQAVAFGRLGTLSGIGLSLGSMISGHIVEAFPVSGFLVIACFVVTLFAINTGLINLLPVRAKEKKDDKKESVAVTPNLIDSVKNSLKESIDEFHQVDWTVYWDAFLFKLIITLCLYMYFSNYSIVLKTKHSTSPKLLGYIIAFQGGVGSLCSYFIGYINQFYKEDKDVLTRTYHCFIAVSVGLLGMGLAPNIYLYLLFIVPFSMGASVSRVSGMELLMKKGNTEHRGSVIGAIGTIRSVSGVVTPIIAGAVSEYLGVTYVIFVAAFISATGIVASYKIRSQSIRAKTKSD